MTRLINGALVGLSVLVKLTPQPQLDYSNPGSPCCPEAFPLVFRVAPRHSIPHFPSGPLALHLTPNNVSPIDQI